MRTDHYHIAIVGCGCAGIAAADKLAGSNLEVVLIDENSHPGGQYLRTIPANLGTAFMQPSDHTGTIGRQMIENIKRRKITIQNRARVLGIYPGNELLVEDENTHSHIIKADLILIAAGAREKFLPFKGWTLPGVISAGAAQILMKSSGILPWKKAIIGGAGLFLYRVAYDYITCRGQLLCLVDQTSRAAKLSGIMQVFRQVPKLMESARFLKRIYSSPSRVRHGTKIIEARGNKYLEEVITAKIDRDGNIRNATERRHGTGGLAISYGFAPNIELAQQAGCDVAFDRERGGWFVAVDAGCATSVPAIYAAGETIGIGGAEKAMLEGELAALSILHRFDQIPDSDFTYRQNRLVRKQKNLQGFAVYFNRLSELPSATIRQIPDETVICRCEGIKMSDIRQAVANGCKSPGAVKRATRIGMGICQGRTCGPVLNQIVSALAGTPVGQMKPLTARIPVKAVRVRSVIG